MDIKIIRSDRKTIEIQIKRNLQIIVRAPKWATDAQIQQFIKMQSLWIESTINKAKEKSVQEEPAFTSKEIEELADQALVDIPKRVAHFAPLVGVNYGRITIRNQKTKWGSCSGKGNLNFNCLLMLCPEQVRDYVVVHELCHRLEMNHSPRFWAEVERILPDYKQRRQWLKDNGGRFVLRMRKD